MKMKQTCTNTCTKHPILPPSRLAYLDRRHAPTRARLRPMHRQGRSSASAQHPGLRRPQCAWGGCLQHCCSRRLLSTCVFDFAAKAFVARMSGTCAEEVMTHYPLHRPHAHAVPFARTQSQQVRVHAAGKQPASQRHVSACSRQNTARCALRATRQSAWARESGWPLASVWGTETARAAVVETARGTAQATVEVWGNQAGQLGLVLEYVWAMASAPPSVLLSASL